MGQIGVQRIIVRGFKSIGELDLDLHPLNVLIGANGAGKSNFIGIFRLLNELSEQRLQMFVARSGGADALLHFGRKKTSEIYFHLDDGENGYETRLMPDAVDGLTFSDERALFYGNGIHAKPYDERMGTGHRETNLVGSKRSTPEYVLGKMKTWKVYHFHDTSESAPMKQTGDIEDNAMLRADAGNLAAFLFLLREQYRTNYDQIVNTIQMVAPFFRDFSLRPSRLNKEKILLEWTERATDAYMNAHALSDGTLRFICLATLLLQPELPSTILIDEPELGLHPSAITALTELFRFAATRTQLIVSTQSVPLVNQLTPEDLIVVDRINNEGSSFRRFASDELSEWMGEYALGDLWEKNLLGGRP